MFILKKLVDASRDARRRKKSYQMTHNGGVVSRQKRKKSLVNGKNDSEENSLLGHYAEAKINIKTYKDSITAFSDFLC
jgi:hypothetical protein